MKTIIPAILTNGLSDLENKLKRIEGLTNWVQIDIADGKFVKNTSVALEDIFNINLVKKFSVELHLMVQNPETYFSACQKIHAKRVIFHIEAVKDAQKVLSHMEPYRFQKGIALNPNTNIEKIKSFMPKLDMVLLMSVNPGFQGQIFIDTTLDKIAMLRKIAPQIKIEVDGGVNENNIKEISDAGADYMVVGSNLFENTNIKKQFEILHEKISG